MLITSLVLSTEDVGSTKTCSSNLSWGRANDCGLRSKCGDSMMFGGAEPESIFGELVFSVLTLGGKGPVACADVFRKKAGRAVDFDLRDIWKLPYSA